MKKTQETKRKLCNGYATSDSCRCGSSVKSGSPNDKLLCVSSHCPCKRSEKKCTTKCYCRNCKNPYGIKCELSTPTKLKRSKACRSPRQSIKRLKTVAYVGNENCGKWSDMETIALHLAIKDENQNKTNQVMDSFNKLAKICMAEKCTEFLREKQQLNITGKINNQKRAMAALREFDIL